MQIGIGDLCFVIVVRILFGVSELLVFIIYRSCGWFRVASGLRVRLLLMVSVAWTVVFVDVASVSTCRELTVISLLGLLRRALLRSTRDL